jgi:hypothetical protein
MFAAPPLWTDRASCAGRASAHYDPWHPPGKVEGNDARDRRDFAVAAAICRSCPVIEECRQYGVSLLAEAPVEGMFGGLTPKQLARLARDQGAPLRRMAAHGTRARYVGGCSCDRCVRGNAVGEHERRLAS